MEIPGQGMRFRSYGSSHRGRVRTNNEDSVHLWATEQGVLAVVADGMGGAAAGEEASRIAIEEVRKSLVRGGFKQPEDYATVEDERMAMHLLEAVQRANLAIVQRAREMPEFKGMGTTLTLALTRGDHAMLAHVGDSRCYLVRGSSGEIEQITSDHSFVQALLDAGHITPDEAEDHPMKNVLYRALGQGQDVDVDIVFDVKLHPGDTLVLCSDGLTLHVNAEEIAREAIASSDPARITERLIALANERGGRDNISVIAVRADDLGQSETTEAEAELFDYNDSDPTVPIQVKYPGNGRDESLSGETRPKDPPRSERTSTSYGGDPAGGRDLYMPWQ